MKTITTFLNECTIKAEAGQPGHFDFANTLLLDNFWLLEDPNHKFWSGCPQIILTKEEHQPC
jgi:hypothetical protein